MGSHADLHTLSIRRRALWAGGYEREVELDSALVVCLEVALLAGGTHRGPHFGGYALTQLSIRPIVLGDSGGRERK
ncbi:hypothetical protein [Arthrobacter sp. NPDC090010]|uniref:hypothetical protein n=1 Tax=Arthrobacter sp. NPDC090010 TaxID=3363942 RepID=UPI0038188AF6